MITIQEFYSNVKLNWKMSTIITTLHNNNKQPSKQQNRGWVGRKVSRERKKEKRN